MNSADRQDLRDQETAILASLAKQGRCTACDNVRAVLAKVRPEDVPSCAMPEEWVEINKRWADYEERIKNLELWNPDVRVGKIDWGAAAEEIINRMGDAIGEGAARLEFLIDAIKQAETKPGARNIIVEQLQLVLDTLLLNAPAAAKEETCSHPVEIGDANGCPECGAKWGQPHRPLPPDPGGA